MTKRIMSIAAAAAVLTSGAMAFDTNDKGEILTRDLTAKGNYTNGKVAQEELYRSGLDLVYDNKKGDALIYPAFNAKEDWGTEIAFRNNLKNSAVAAKVVVYAADDSREVMDFNVYLSAKDQCRFTIKKDTDGKTYVYSEDGSVLVASNKNGARFASASEPFKAELSVDEGYVIVYGMGQFIREVKGGLDGYHNDHNGLFLDYRDALNKYRKGWDTITMHQGVYVGEDPIQSPAMDEIDEDDYSVKEVHYSALSGTERIFNTTGVSRDMLLAPTALLNFTDGSNDGQIILWAPGEYATLADRNLGDTDDNASTPDVYDIDQTVEDNRAFNVAKATYTYEAGSANFASNVDNKLIVTQPMKRLLVQMGEADRYWVKACTDSSEDHVKYGQVTGLEWGFRTASSIYNEDEYLLGGIDSDDPVISPANSAEQGAYCLELQELANIEAEALEREPEEFADKNGFVDVDFTTKTTNFIPAIITQMSASKVGENAHINWVYSPVNKFANVQVDPVDETKIK